MEKQPKIIKTDRPQPDGPKEFNPVPPATAPAPKPEIKVFDFNENQIATGVFCGTTEHGHLFKANGVDFLVPSTDEYQTVNEAMATLKPNQTLVKIEYLGYSYDTKKGEFEVSDIS